MIRGAFRAWRSNWALDPWATIGFLLAIAVLLIVDVVAYRTVQQLHISSGGVLDTHALMHSAEELLGHLVDAETGQRGYLLTGDDEHLSPYRMARAKVGPALASLKERAAASCPSRFVRLESSIEERLAELERGIDLRRGQGVDFAVRLLRQGDGGAAMDEVRRQLRGVTIEARDFFESQASEVRAAGRSLYAAIVAGNLLALVLIAGGLLALNRGFARQRAAEDGLRLTQQELERRVSERTAELSRANRALQEEIAEHGKSEDQAARLAAIIESSEDAVLATDLHGTIVAVNPAAERLFGYDHGALLSQPLCRLFPPEGPIDIATYLEPARRGERVATFELVARHRDGSPIAVSVGLSPVRDRSGQPSGAAAILRDIRERRKLETQLLQAQKMEAIGRLAAGVAHDFNNLLTVIIGFSDYLLGRLATGSMERSAAEEILKAGERSAGLARQLLALSRRQMTAPQVLDLNEIITGLSKALPRLLGSDIQLSHTLQSDLRPIWADPGQIEQVLLNLAVNARDAMPGGGQLTIETQNVELDVTYTHNHAGLTPGPYVLLAVSDNGCGMTDEVRAHLFEPFFTTKERGKGTGLGLATVYSVVRQCGGHIAVYSEPGRGATFKVYLPPSRQASAAATSAAPAAPARAGTETILLVEDDEAVRTLIGAVLRQHGYTVLEAADGARGLQLAQEYDGPIHLLVVDVVLPNLNGREVADRLLRTRPSMKVLYLSGYASHAVVRHGVLEAEMAYMQKPFTPHALAARVRELLEREAGAGR